MAVVNVGRAVEGEHDPVEVVAEEAGAVFTVDAVGGRFQARSETALGGGRAGAVGGHLDDIRGSHGLAPEEMNIERLPALALDLIGHPVHRGHREAQVHLLAGGLGGAEATVEAAEVARPRGDEAQELRPERPLVGARLALRFAGEQVVELGDAARGCAVVPVAQPGQGRAVDQRGRAMERRVHEPPVEHRQGVDRSWLFRPGHARTALPRRRCGRGSDPWSARG